MTERKYGRHMVGMETREDGRSANGDGGDGGDNCKSG